MSEVAIHCEGLSKQYRIGKRERYWTLRDTITNTLRAPFRGLSGLLNPESGIRNPESDNTIWALKDVSFEIKRGEVVGIIGRNGSGKSTLLKILSRITEPTEGTAEIHGRVGSLLEVGTGFHPELTGRENIYLNGAILGMKRVELDRKFDEIVAFAEVEKFIDTPVKHYSSGMHVRLAFAVAAHLEPEILLVDEVLAVGDAAFQKKCIGKVGDVANEGRTVLFVSHNMSLLKILCRYGIYLHASRLVIQTDIHEAVRQYSSELETAQPQFPITVKDITIHSFAIEQYGMATTKIKGSFPFVISIDFEILRNISAFRLGVYLNNPLGGTIARSFLADWMPERETIKSGHYQARLAIPAKLLMAGNYSVLLHSSRFGVGDYLSRSQIQHTITVDPPTDFNAAHRDESFDATIILSNPWELRRRE